MKVCRTCKQSLPLSSFCKQSKNKDGLNSQCRSCYKKEYEKRKRKIEENFTWEGVKECRTCKELLPKTEFPRAPTILDGVSSDCKTCYNKKSREHWKSKREHYNSQQKERHHKDPLKLMYYKAKSRSKKEGIPFNITLSDLVLPKVCPILGIPLVVGNIGFHANSPSLDRFKPELGYTKGNINVISMLANRIKTDATTQQVLKVAEWMKQKENECENSKHTSRGASTRD